MLNAVVLSLDGDLVALVAAWADAATPKPKLLVLAALQDLVPLPVLVASEVEAEDLEGVQEDLGVAVVVAAAASAAAAIETVSVAVAMEEADEAATEAVAQVLATVPLMELLLVPAVAGEAATVVIAAAEVATTIVAATVTETADPAEQTTSLWVAGTGSVIEVIETIETTEATGTTVTAKVGMAAVVAMTTIHESVGTRATTMTTEASDGGTNRSPPPAQYIHRVCSRLHFLRLSP